MTESLFDTNFTSENEPKLAASATGNQAASETQSQGGSQGVASNNAAGTIASNTDNTSTNSNSAATSTTNGANATTTHSSAPATNDASHSQEHHDDHEGYDNSTSLPSLNDNSNADALINYRVLVSAKEAGCLIGQNGKVIDSIREETNTKAGISRLVAGTHERILTVSGKLDDCAKALSYFAQALLGSSIETYNYFPLKQLSSTPCVEHETTILRLLIPNSQMGTLIGAKGARIQQIQQNFAISMIASKSFLPGSNERLVELQGTVDDLYDALRIISRCLIEDFSSSVGTTTYYVPKSHQLTRKSTATISFPNDMVGALIGKNGSRIQGVRKVSGAMIGIGEAVEGSDERVFTITGTQQAVEKAKSLLYHNLEREEQRRAEATE
ncbi:HEK2 [Candida margitis]|uniref:HEK2 n=1 Tax=Candida margitis TaxID=1775924 RepID=UPI002225D328|nr:HEK2 [Candida margitis]KAI5949851.1 HEK2 [Candida margitis]